MSTLLSLPDAILDQIFIDVGFQQHCAIRPASHKSRHCECNGWVSDGWSCTECQYSRNAVRLFEVCARFHQICTNVLYGRNLFIFLARDNDLSALKRMSGLAIRAMRAIQFVLEQEAPTRRKDWGVRTCKLDSKTPAGIAVVDNFYAMCYVLGRNFETGRVSVDIKCEVVGPKTADTVLGALRLLPRLKNLVANFEPITWRAAQVRNMIGELGEKMTTEEVVKPFPFEELPVELQMRVLDMTDLVGSTGFELRRRVDLRRCLSLSTKNEKAKLLRDELCCKSCVSLELRLHRQACDDDDDFHDFALHCRCRFRSTWSSSCTCDTLTSLSTVSRAMRKMARIVWLSHSAIRMVGDAAEVSIAMSKLGSEQLTWLRCLVITMARVKDLLLATQNWIKVLESLETTTASQLLEVNFVMTYKDSVWYGQTSGHCIQFLRTFAIQLTKGNAWESFKKVSLLLESRDWTGNFSECASFSGGKWRLSSLLGAEQI